MKIITEQDVMRAELENKAMNLRREEIQKPDTVLKYYLDRENNISAITMSLSEYKEKDFPLSTIRNTRRDIELFLEKKGINLEIGSLLQKKGLFMKIERAKGNKNF